MGQHHSGLGGNHSCLQNRVQGMVVKIDIVNAFDRVRHAFLLRVMRKFGFNPTFIWWVKAYISEPWIAPLINGRVAGVFKTYRGLCQGCPSPIHVDSSTSAKLSVRLSKARPGTHRCKNGPRS